MQLRKYDIEKRHVIVKVYLNMSSHVKFLQSVKIRSKISEKTEDKVDDEIKRQKNRILYKFS